MERLRFSAKHAIPINNFIASRFTFAFLPSLTIASFLARARTFGEFAKAFVASRLCNDFAQNRSNRSCGFDKYAHRAK